MKKLAVTLCLTAFASAAFAQGTVAFANSSTTLIRTNALAVNGGTSGNTTASGAAPGGYLFEVLTANSTVTSVDASLQGLLSSAWSDTGLIASNSSFASGGRIAAVGASLNVNNWAGGSQQSFIVVGWSANEGSSWATVKAELAGATFDGTQWQNGGLVVGGFVGTTTIQAGQAGGGPNSLPAFALFGSGAGSQGTPITTPSTLFVVTATPEPTSLALAGLGLAAGMILRRRK